MPTKHDHTLNTPASRRPEAKQHESSTASPQEVVMSCFKCDMILDEVFCISCDSPSSRSVSAMTVIIDVLS